MNGFCIVRISLNYHLQRFSSRLNVLPEKDFEKLMIFFMRIHFIERNSRVIFVQIDDLVCILWFIWHVLNCLKIYSFNVKFQLTEKKKLKLKQVFLLLYFALRVLFWLQPTSKKSWQSIRIHRQDKFRRSETEIDVWPNGNKKVSSACSESYLISNNQNFKIQSV